MVQDHTGTLHRSQREMLLSERPRTHLMQTDLEKT